MKQGNKILAIFLLILVGFAIEIYACHTKDLGATAKGHYHWSKNMGGSSRLTEGSTVSVSTSTNCDAYIAFIKREYDMLAENAAQGQGPHLTTLAGFFGCSQASHEEFAATLHARYNQIFYQTPEIHPEIFQKNIQALIVGNPNLQQECQL